MDDDKTVIVNATKGQIEDFIASLLWNDMQNELESWKEGFDAEMRSIVGEAEEKNPSTASVLLHMGDLSGRANAVDYLLSIPNVFLQILEEQKDDNRRNKA